MGEIVFYGERGIVNAIVRYLMCTKDSVERCREFLSLIRWCGKTQRVDWLNKLINVDIILEVGLGQFGDPDIIFVCTLEDATKRYIFMEAKVIPYELSAQSNDKGMKTPGFNSSINGQLALKYRFVQALMQWDEKEGPIVEPEELFKAYKKELNDPMSVPRRLVKKEILKNIISRFELNKVNPESCYFVALTNDKEPGPIGQVSEEYVPCILGNDGSKMWADTCNLFGWIGLDLLPEALKNDDCYSRAYASTVSRFIDSKDIPLGKYTGIRTKAFEKLSGQQKETLKQLETLCLNIFPKEAVIQRNGSFSIMLQGRTLIKVLTKSIDKDNVYIGLTPQIHDICEDLSREFKPGFLISAYGTKFPFDEIAIDATRVDEYLPNIEKLFACIHEILW